MLRCLHDLNRRKIANLVSNLRRQRDLGHAEGAGVGVVGRAGDLEGRDDRVAHVLGDLAETHVDVDQSRQMAWEPAGLDGNGAAGDGPLGAVARGRHATACVMLVLSHG